MTNKYDQMRDQMQTGDILLFSGNGFISRAIQTLTGSPWSHVGTVLRLPEYDFVCCFESTTLSSIPDLTTGAKVKGVQLVPLRARVDGYDGTRVAWRPVEGPRPPAAITAALRVRDEFAGVPYEQNQLELLSSALDATGLLTNQPDASSVFCSEISSIKLMRMGWLLNDGTPPNERTPANFADDVTLPWAHDVSVGPIIDLLD